MKNLIKKLSRFSFIFLALVSLGLTFLVPKVKAASSTTVTTSWYNQSFEDWYKKVYETGNDTEIFGERYTAAQVQWIFYSLIAIPQNVMVGGNTDALVCLYQLPLVDFKACIAAIKTGIDQINPITDSKGGSFLAFTTKNPISGISYTKDLLAHWHIIPEAKAQGAGFQLANPVLQLWRLTRNVAFSFLILIIIVFAFMIMFRVKINPQTVITVQSALPKIIAATILITFSYAIAGFAIDLMYVVLGLLVAVLTGASPSLFAYPGASATKNWQIIMNFLLNRSIFEIFLGYWYALFMTALSQILGGKFGMTIIVLIVWFCATFILLLAAIKTVINLLKNFAQILLLIITGPLEILFGTVTQGSGFGSWLAKLVSRLAVYPIVALMILMAHFFLAQALGNDIWVQKYSTDPDFMVVYARIFPFNPAMNYTGNDPWKVPFTLGEEGGAGIVWIVLSIVIMSMIPKVFDIIKSFMEKKPFEYGSGIGEVTGYMQQAGRTSQSIIDIRTPAIQNLFRDRATGKLNRLGKILYGTSYLGYTPQIKG